MRSNALDGHESVPPKSGGTMSLADLALDDRGHGKAVIYQRGNGWKDYARVPNPDAAEEKGDWSDVTRDQPTAVDTKIPALLEYAYRNPTTVKKVIRFSRSESSPVLFKRGQLVHHTKFGTGTISSIQGCNVTVAFCDEERELDFEQVVTRTQAEQGWEACYAHGDNRRLEEGRWLWIVRSLCSRHGDWSAFLHKWGIPRSSAFDLIQRFLQERFAETRQTSGNRTEGAQKVDERATDAVADKLNAERKQLVDEERTKRDTAKLTYWSVRIKLPKAVAEGCREKYKEAGDDAKEYWVRAAYRFVDREDELESGSDAAEEDSSDE
jgi:hypothetical protein